MFRLKDYYYTIKGDSMYKKIIMVVLGMSFLCLGFSKKEDVFLYKYEIVLNSDEYKDVAKGYLYKEHLIDEYERLIKYLDPSLHTDAIKKNIDIFASDGSRSEYRNGVIVVYIGDARGSSLQGELKSDSCDNSKMRIKFFLSKYFLK